MSTTTDTAPTAVRRTPAPPRGGVTIDDWRPEDDGVLGVGRPARRPPQPDLVDLLRAPRLLGLAALVGQRGDAAAGSASTSPSRQLFVLVAIPNLVGALIRLPYTFAVPRFGGRNWTVVSASLLLVPTLLFAWAVQRPETPYWVFCLIAATAGLGGGNFASSMANINFFYPIAQEGHRARPQRGRRQPRRGRSSSSSCRSSSAARASSGWSRPARTRCTSSGPATCTPASRSSAAVAAWLFMNNLTGAKSSPREQLAVVRYKHTWVMSFLYIGTFGSFIGYSAAMPLLIKINFWNQPVPEVPGIGINFAYYAFLGALVGSIARPFGGWLADKYGGARVTLLDLRRDDRRHPGRDLHADAADPGPAVRGPRRPEHVRLLRGHPGRGRGQLGDLPVVPRGVPLRLRRDRHRQRLDVPDDPADPAAAGRADHDRRDPAGRHGAGHQGVLAPSSASPAPWARSAAS